MALAPADLAWAARWKAVHPTAQYNKDFGIEGAWRAAFDDWKYPLEDAEQDVEWNGNTYKGRTFSGVGLVIWDPATGPVVIGWP